MDRSYTKNEKILDGKMPRGRRIGRPRLRWIDDVEENLKQLGVRRWRNKALDRDVWASITKEAEAKLKGA
ncbi:hypothetical protein C0J52_25858 [Blattella germanica]|nr:hypothetical protein C0J52_25858 [Blattella germanica]